MTDIDRLARGLTEAEVETLEAWSYNVMLECMGREESKIEIALGGAILDLRDLDSLLSAVRERRLSEKENEGG